jgi:UPF0042 nucleotide-binding protein
MNTPTDTTSHTASSDIELLLVTGMSGSGKSIALTALEDLGYYCVDNLPPELLQAFIALEQSHHTHKVAIAIDVRSGASLPGLPQQLDLLRQMADLRLRIVFLDATTDALVRRFSETRRRHPLSLRITDDDQHRAMTDIIEYERDLLIELREQSQVLDTSLLLPAQLRTEIKALIGGAQAGLTLVFESFAFMRGIPIDADFLFDVRMLPNPHYDPTLRPLTGCDLPVVAFLARQPDVQRMEQQIGDFLRQWLPQMQLDHRSHVTVAIGCTGGQHRSVYLVERLGAAFGTEWATRVRHREVAHLSVPIVR